MSTGRGGGSHLEGGGAIDREANGKNGDKTGGGQASSDDAGVCVTERAELDEGTGEQEAVGEADLHSAEDGGNTSTVGGKAG